MGGLLSDGDREKMEQEGVTLAPGGKEQAFLQQHMVYTCLSMPTEKLFISYGASDAEGASLRPSGVVARVSRIFGNMAPKSALTEKKIESVSMAAAAFSHLVDAMASGPLCGVDQMVYGWFKNSDAWREKLLVLERLRRRENRAVPLRKEQMELLFPKDIKTSVSRLEQYNACPFSYFMNYMLKAAPRQKSGVALPDSGTYLHRMMDGFCRVLAGDGLTWRQATDEYIARTTETLAQELYGGMNRYLLESSPRTAFLFSKLNAISQNAIRCVRDHISQSKFEPLGYEIQFDENGRFKPLTVTLPTGQAVSLSGRIDRADVLKGETETFLRVVDYKSGDKSFDLGEVYHGLNLQLAVYLTALCGQTGARPAGILYFKLDDPVAALEQAASDVEIEKELLKKLRMKGLILSEEPVVGRHGKLFGRGKIFAGEKNKKRAFGFGGVGGAVSAAAKAGEKNCGANFRKASRRRRFHFPLQAGGENPLPVVPLSQLLCL